MTVPGEVLVGEGPVELFAGRERREIEVVNAGDRPIQVGSHYHFAETNPSLSFDRAAARGFRLAIPAGTSVRFEPGIERQVELVALAGHRIVPGLRAEVAGALDAGAAHGKPAEAPKADEARAGVGASDGDGPIGDGPIGDGPIGDGPIGDGRIGDGRIGDGSIGDGSIGDGPIDDGPIDDGRIDGSGA